MKKICCFFMSIIMLFTFSNAGIIEDSADTLKKMKILNGYEDGSLKLENNITRAEFCVLILNMLGVKVDEKLENKFEDVKEGAWYYNAINKVAEMEYIKGYKEDGTFRPSNKINYPESCSIILGVLGQNKDLEGKWPNNVIDKAEEIGITKGLKEVDATHKMTRGEISLMLVNSMSVKVK